MEDEKQESPLLSRLVEIDKMTEVLNGSVEKLSARLTPIMRPQNEKERGEVPKEIHCCDDDCEVISSLDHLSKKLRKIDEILISTSRRLTI